MMKNTFGALLLLVALFTTTAAFPSLCGTSGMTALRANNESGFLFYVFREGPDVYFAIPGK